MGSISRFGRPMSEPRETETAVPVHLAPATVLVVEDNPDHADLVDLMLAQARGRPWAVEHAGDLASALTRLGRKGVDVVLLDLNLPDSRRLDTVARLCAAAPDLAVVVATSSDDQELGVVSIHSGAQDYLMKGQFDPAGLNRTLRLAIERKQGEVAASRLAAIVEASDDAIVGHTLEGIVTSWNAGAARIYGYAGAEMLGRSIGVLFPRERLQEATDILIRVGEGRHVLTYDTVQVTKAGRTFDVSLAASPVLGSSGMVTAASFIARDITARRQAADALAESERRYRLLFDNNPQPMWVYELATLRFLTVNQAACRHYGYSQQEFLSMTLRDIRPPEEIPVLMRDVESIDDQPRIKELRRHRKKDGSPIDVEVDSYSMTFGDVPARLVQISDVTERRRLEEQFRQAQKMEAIGRLAGGVAHDFNNVLGVIIGYAEIIRRGATPGAPLHARLDEILKAAGRAADLTQQLLAFSRKQVLQPKVLDLNTVAGEMEKMLQRLIGEDVQLVTSFGPAGRVKADPGQLSQIIVNLAVNARDAMPEGGTLVLETANVHLDASYVADHPEARPGPHVMLAVSDTGTGMSPEVRARIFEPFFTTKAEGKGTGLGLATVYGIVRQSGGHVNVYSEVDRGTTFKIYLPRVDEAADARPVEEGRPQGGSERVLLVEDDDALRAMTAELLHEAGYTVVAAADGAEALRECARAAVPDLIITDVVMPRMTGRALSDQLRSRSPRLRVLFMSGYTDAAVLYQGLLEPGTAFLQKPFSPEGLLRKVREVLDQPGPAA